MKERDVQAIVIGSGFGGAVAALRLGQAGVRTVVLERGRDWEIRDPSRNATFATFEEPDGRAEWFNSVTRTPAYEGTPIERQAGVLEILEVSGSTFLTGAGVGGGSLVYGGILIQPPAELWSQMFPASIPYDEMDRVYFERVRQVIPMDPIPDDILNSEYYAGLKVYWDHARNAGFPELSSTREFRSGTVRFPMAVNWDWVREEIAGTRVPSVIAAQFWYGNNSGAKRTLDQNYLRLARQTGNVVICPLHGVTEIAEMKDGGYAVSCTVIDERGNVLDRKTLTCDFLFMAAGVFGTCRLLMRAKARGGLPRISDPLGRGFGNDGDIFLIRNELKERTNPHLGGPGCVVIQDYGNPVMPSIMMRAPLPRFAQDFPEKNAIGSFIFSHTFNRGVIGYDPAADAMSLDFIPDSDAAARSLAQRLNAANGGQIHSATTGITGHQLGGACMGMVCDEVGRVRGHRHLYVVDGALIPGSSTCMNPAFTIAAIAERCLERLLAEEIRA